MIHYYANNVVFEINLKLKQILIGKLRSIYIVMRIPFHNFFQFHNSIQL